METKLKNKETKTPKKVGGKKENDSWKKKLEEKNGWIGKKMRKRGGC